MKLRKGRLEVRAAVLHEARAPLNVETVLLDPPRSGEVLVRIAAAGVCHSDLHLAEGHLGEGRWPTVLGHEGAGIVEAVGEGVSRVEPGQRVALCFLPACGECRRCLGGQRNLCEPGSNASFAGTMLDGTHQATPRRRGAAQALPRHRLLRRAMRRPDGLGRPASRRTAACGRHALIGCGVVTGFGAVRNAARVAAGDSVCVVGCGGVGLQVIAAARLAGADPIVAVDRLPAKLELASSRGATHAVDASVDDPIRATHRLTGGGVDHAFEVVGRPETIRLAWETLRPGGNGRGRRSGAGRSRGVCPGTRFPLREVAARLVLRVGRPCR